MVNIAQGFAAVFGYDDPSESQKNIQEVQRLWVQVIPGQSIHTEPLFHRPTWPGSRTPDWRGAPANAFNPQL